MLYSLRNPNSNVTERLIFHLSPVDIDDVYWRERLAIFAPVQKQAVCAYLRFIQSELVDEGYDEHLARAQTVWECGSYPPFVPAAVPCLTRRVSLLANIATVFSQHGYYTRAFARWQAAWQLTKAETDFRVRAIADYAIAQCFELDDALWAM
jgi:hypothetical protein